MLANAAKVALLTAAVAFFTTSADAEKVHPKCVKSKDKVKCTCFFANGGLIEFVPGGGRRAVIWSMGQLDGYIACMKRNGRA
jgi:hypothetical protein